MKIAVLEWICGGGMSNLHTDEIPSSLRHEGAAMLKVLLQAFRQSGCRVATAVDQRMLGMRDWDAEEILPVPCGSLLVENTVPAQWLRLARDADFSIVIAPELESVLETSLAVLGSQNDRLLNCSGAFLSTAADKFKTAACLQENRIAHPPTVELGGADPSWLAAFSEQQLILKPRDGAGSEALLICNRSQLAERRQLLDEVRFIAQPFLNGEAFSCSAIVDRNGTCHWFPLVCQDLNPSLKYLGGRIAAAEMQQKRPLELLSSCVAALGSRAWGWISVDLLFERSTQSWTVIEVNPRFTTSVIGLSVILKGGLGSYLCDAFLGGSQSVEVEPGQLRFLANGQVFKGN